MALERQFGKIILICDDCDDENETGETDFNVAMAHAIRLGWGQLRIQGVWKHYCPTCNKTATA